MAAIPSGIAHRSHFGAASSGGGWLKRVGAPHLTDGSLPASSAQHANSFCLKLLIGSVCFAVIPILICTTSLNHSVERLIFKGNKGFTLVHDFLQSATRFTSLPKTSNLIVHQHVPRTAGDSMRTLLYADPALYDSTPYGCDDKSAPMHPLLWQLEHDPEGTRARLELMKNASVVKGYFSTEDLGLVEASTGRKLTKFVILRHPIERVLSFYNFMNDRDRSRRWGTVPLEVFVNGTIAAYESCPLELPAAQVRRCYGSYVSNAMTWQLGGPSLHLDFRSSSYDEELVLARAKQALHSMAFIGFYETLATDFWELRRRIFPHSTVPSIFLWAFYFGTIIGSPHSNVAKLSGAVPLETREELYRMNSLDLELFEYAQRVAGRSIHLYPSYLDYFWNHLFTLLLIAAILGSFAALFVLFFIQARALCSFCCSSCCSCLKDHHRGSFKLVSKDGALLSKVL